MNFDVGMFIADLSMVVICITSKIESTTGRRALCCQWEMHVIILGLRMELAPNLASLVSRHRHASPRSFGPDLESVGLAAEKNDYANPKPEQSRSGPIMIMIG
jgi:hypothetical protein